MVSLDRQPLNTKYHIPHTNRYMPFDLFILALHENSAKLTPVVHIRDTKIMKKREL